MKKILLTLLVISFTTLFVNAQNAKTATAATSATKKVTNLSSALDATKLTLVQKSNCKELIYWCAKRKQLVKSDNTLTAAEKATKYTEFDTILKDRLSKIADTDDMKIIAPYMYQ